MHSSASQDEQVGPVTATSHRGRNWLVPLLIILLALTGCGGSAHDSGSAGSTGLQSDPRARTAAGSAALPDQAESLPGQADSDRAPGSASKGNANQDSANQGSVKPGGSSLDKAAASSATPMQQRDIVRTATLNVTVRDVDQAADRAVAATVAAGGRADGDDRSSESTGRWAELVLRVPPDKLSALIDTVVKLGHENSRTDQGQDVTASRADTDSRVATLRTSVARLRELLGKSGSISDLVALESQLTARESELESTQAQQRALADQVTLASLTVDLTTVAPPAAHGSSGPSGFGKALGHGLHGMLLAVRWVGAVLGYALPFLLVAAVVAVPAWWLVRVRNRAGRQAPEPVTE